MDKEDSAAVRSPGGRSAVEVAIAAAVKVSGTELESLVIRA
jgi:hypothetical protein